MPEVDSLTLRVEADMKQLRREMDETGRATEAFAKKIDKSFDEIGRPLNTRTESSVSNALERLRGNEGIARRLQMAGAESPDARSGDAPSPRERIAELAGSAEEAQSAVRSLSGAARDLGFTFASSFEDAVVEGRRLSEVIDGLEKDILRILTRRLVTEPLAGAVTGAIGGGLGLFAGSFHAGGKVGSSPVSGRVVPASLFAGAPRFATGGLVARAPRLAPGEVPAILHRGEVVRTPAQEAALARSAGRERAPPIVVNIQTPDPRAFNDSRGQIQAMLADAVREGRRFR